MVSSQPIAHRLVAIVPSRDLDVAEAFFARLGLVRPDGEKAADDDSYRILGDDQGAQVHLTKAVPGWLEPGRNPFGVYLYVEDVDAMAERLRDMIIEREKAPTHKEWGMYEFAVNGPDDLLVRIGWPSRLRR